MSVINSQPLIGASGNQSTAYNLTRSLRFRSSASASLSRTPSSQGSTTTFTWSAWVKRGSLGSFQQLFACPNNNTAFRFTDTNLLTGYFVYGNDGFFNTNAVYRDTSAWYHIVLSIDTTKASSTDRIKVYVNGVLQSFNAGTTSIPTQNYSTAYNRAVLHTMGEAGSADYFDGYMTEINFVDGQQLEPSSFGETDTATGVWKPKKYTGTYGTNGFYLKFDNLTSTSTLGNDSSGNNNTWTVNNISLTSGSTYDSMKDVPTLTDADTANYAVLNPLNKSFNTQGTFSNGNLTYSQGAEDNSQAVSTFIPTTGKWYCEIIYTTATGYPVIGVHRATDRGIWDAVGVAYRGNSGNKVIDGTGSSYGAAFGINDLMGIALDLDGGTVTFYKNNVSQGAITLPSSTSGWTPFLGSSWYLGNGTVGHANFGQRPFAYTPPSGFKALNTFNLPTPTIGATASTQANKYFDATTYTGNGSTLSVTNAGGFQPDLVWYKGRSAAYNHRLFDAIRGATKDLQSNATDAEGTISGLTAFNSNGFTLGSEVGGNNNGSTYVAWQWNGGGSNATNTSGTITSTVRANTTAGFSIATFTCTGVNVNGTVGHGLGVAPNMIITKSRGSGSNWVVYHSSVSTDVNKFLRLNDTSATVTLSNIWGDALPTSTVFGIRGDVTLAASATAVAYCFAEVAGYSKFGSYTGNGSTDGPFVFTGFRPRWIIFKRTDSAAGWLMLDAARNTFNVLNGQLYANVADAEATGATADFLSNGFKIRETGGGTNANGGTYIYACFAENPFKYSLAR